MVCGGAVLSSLEVLWVEDVEALLSVLEVRERKGRDGVRYVAKSGAGDGMLGNDGIVGSKGGGETKMRLL